MIWLAASFICLAMGNLPAAVVALCLWFIWE